MSGRKSKELDERFRIDANDPHELSYIHQQFPWLSPGEIRDAIRAHGPDRDNVLRYLDEKSGKRPLREERD